MSRLVPSEFDWYEGLLTVLAEAQEAAGWDTDTRKRLAARQRATRAQPGVGRAAGERGGDPSPCPAGPGGDKTAARRTVGRFAEWAEAIGLRTDAEAARVEAAGLTAPRQHQPPK